MKKLGNNLTFHLKFKHGTFVHLLKLGITPCCLKPLNGFGKSSRILRLENSSIQVTKTHQFQPMDLSAGSMLSTGTLKKSGEPGCKMVKLPATLRKEMALLSLQFMELVTWFLKTKGREHTISLIPGCKIRWKTSDQGLIITLIY